MRKRLKECWLVIIVGIIALFCVCMLVGCGPKQEPQSTQIVYQITDQRQITQIIGDNNTTMAKTASVAEQSAEPEVAQTTEATTKSGAWIVWLVLIALALGAGAFVYFRYFYQRSKK